jgi:hypothetical protein
LVSGEAWRLFKEAYPERDFSYFLLEACLDFSNAVLNCLGSLFNVTATIFLLKLRALELL